MEVQIRQVPFSEIESLSRAAQADGVKLKETRNTEWFALYLDGEVVAVGAVLWMSNAARLKAGWTAPEWRGVHMFGWKVLQARIEHIDKTRPGTEIQVFSRRPSMFLRLGFKKTGREIRKGSPLLIRPAPT